ncbi:MAG: DUF6175 family protein [Alistipes sp.]|nr:DUF6175 family protein [Alistipes sp.]
MRKLFLSMACLMLCISAFGQAKRPSIMVVPSDSWCVKYGYVQEFDNMGTKQIVPDYRAALQNDSDLRFAITKIGEMMSERGFPLKDLEASLKSLQEQAAEDAMLTSKQGSDVAESPIDKLKKVAKSDIVMDLEYTVNQIGPKKSLTFNLRGLDAYTDKQVAAASGTGTPSFTPELAILIEEAVLGHIDNFNAQLQAHFDDLFAKGREIVVRIKVWGDAEYDLESEFGDDDLELGQIIEDWLADNAVNGAFNTVDATENMMLFEQVRIPMVTTTSDGKERQVDARRWVGGLRKYLKDNFEIESKLMMQGLGQAQLVIGSK